MRDGHKGPQQQLSESAASPGCIQELEQLRAAAQALKADVDLLRANQESQRKQEETLVLGQLKKTVQALQAESSAILDQQHAVCPLLPSAPAAAQCLFVAVAYGQQPKRQLLS